MYACLECGHKFRSVAAAKKAAFSDCGCPKCGGSDIDLATAKPAPSGATLTSYEHTILREAASVPSKSVQFQIHTLRVLRSLASRGLLTDTGIFFTLTPAGEAVAAVK